MTRSRVSGFVPFALASLALVVPCFWQSRIQAGDLASHSYNAWLVQLIDAGRAPGLSVAPQLTNVLFDWILSALARGLGSGPAERVAAAFVVLVFAWGAFAFVSAVAGRRAWDALPCLAALAYGWVFHIGFFNFQLALGAGLWALALGWDRPLARGLAAVPILALAWLAHPLPVLWAGGLIGFSWLWRALPSPRWRRVAVLAALAAIWLASALVSRAYPTRWDPGQWLLASGASSLRVWDAKYDLLAAALLAVWVALLGLRVARERARLLDRLELALFALCAAAVALVPGSILLPGYGHALVYVAERMSLCAALVLCALTLPERPRAAAIAYSALALVFFAFLYRDERILNGFEDRLDALVAELPPEQRVILGVRDPELRVNALAHMIDRACIGRCFSYANYEPSTLQFRVRVDGPNGIVASTYADSFALQTGRYVVKARDVPLHQVVSRPGGELALRSLLAGEPIAMTELRVLPGLF